LGVEYATVGKTFFEINNDLAKLAGIDTITVPTLFLGPDTSSHAYLTESFKIAEYVSPVFEFLSFHDAV